MNDQVLKVSQVAERLGVCTMTVYRLIRADKIGYIKVSEKSYRIYESALAAYLEGNRHGNAQSGTADGVGAERPGG